jgi:polar amino acid transport system substrate-binding protein
MLRTAIAVLSFLLLTSCATQQQQQVTPAVLADLAPTGKMRAGINAGNAVFAGRDLKTGASSGVVVDLAHELGRRLGVPVELVSYPSAGQLMSGLKTGSWDVAFLASEPARAEEISFSAPFGETDSSYLVRAESELRNAAEVDRKGVRIAVSAKGGNDLFLSRTLKNATLVRAQGTEAAADLFASGKADAYAGLKTGLLATAERVPGSRVLDGRYTTIGYAAGVPKGRDAGAKYVAAFIEEAKANGFVAKAIERSGVRGLSVAPPATAGGSRLEIGGSM